MLRAVEREGWTLQKVVHCIFYPRKDWKAAKICLLLSEPMVNFDFAWIFNPDVIIRPSQRFFVTQVRPDVDIRYVEPIDKLLKKGNYTADVTLEELNEIGRRISKFI